MTGPRAPRPELLAFEREATADPSTHERMTLTDPATELRAVLDLWRYADGTYGYSVEDGLGMPRLDAKGFDFPGEALTAGQRAAVNVLSDLLWERRMAGQAKAAAHAASIATALTPETSVVRAPVRRRTRGS